MIIGLIGTLILTGIGILCTGLLVLAARQFRSDGEPVVELILKELPQTQCAQCGYPGCRPYAEAISKGAAINKCPPGGEETISALARLLGKPAEPLDTTGGDGINRIAIIREQDCIGCALCLPACPVDAIIGAPKFMHTIVSAECTGCELCLPPCPVDCIDMLVVEEQPVTPLLPRQSSAPCIHCGACVDACPRQLAPQQLYLRDDSLDDLESLRLDDCIECGRCDRVCPSGIPLTQTFSASRLRLARSRADSELAEDVRIRVDRHDDRMARQLEVNSYPARGADLLAGLRSLKQTDDQ